MSSAPSSPQPASSSRSRSHSPAPTSLCTASPSIQQSQQRRNRSGTVGTGGVSEGGSTRRKRGTRERRNLVIFVPPWATDDPPSPTAEDFPAPISTSATVNTASGVPLYQSSTTSDAPPPISDEPTKWWTLTLPAKYRERLAAHHQAQLSSSSASSSPTYPKGKERDREKSSSDAAERGEAGAGGRAEGGWDFGGKEIPPGLGIGIEDADGELPPPPRMAIRAEIPTSAFVTHHAQTPGWSSPWRPLSSPDLHSSSGAPGAAHGHLDTAALRRAAERSARRTRWKKFILHSAYVPLLFRALNIGFTGATLGVCVRIRQLEAKNHVLGATGASPIIGIIFAPMTLLHVMVSIYLEYFYGRPIGIWGVPSKMAHTLLDLLFIVFWSAELSLAFDNYLTSPLRCSSASPWWSEVEQSNESGWRTDIEGSLGDRLCDEQAALIGLVFVGMVLYVANLVVSLFRIFLRIARS